MEKKLILNLIFHYIKSQNLLKLVHLHPFHECFELKFELTYPTLLSGKLITLRKNIRDRLKGELCHLLFLGGPQYFIDKKAR